jgi:predicted  nucleic acid-binding Zn-ribbon protein
LASNNARPEQEAFRELSSLVGHLADELASFRKRALQAEGRLRELDTAGAAPRLVERLNELERENAELNRRMDAARDRTRQILDRLRFLRQQHARTGEK